MSVNWHYFKQISRQSSLKNPNTDARPNTVASAQDLQEFTGYMVDNRKQTKAGRAWRAEELRLK